MTFLCAIGRRWIVLHGPWLVNYVVCQFSDVGCDGGIHRIICISVKFLADRMLTPRQIEAFRAVMLTHSMTEAANLLSVTQSAVSKIMKEMEDEVGFSLFARRQGGLVPTSEAKLLFTEVDRVFVGIDRVSRAAERIKARHHGQIKIVAMSALSSAFLQRAVSEFSKTRPTVGVSIETYNSLEVIDLVASGQFDLGYAMSPVRSENVRADTVLRTRCVCILPMGHDLASHDVIDIRDLAGSSFISLPVGNTTRLQIDSICSVMNISRSIIIETNWSVAVAVLVSEGLGVSIIDPFTATLATKLECVVRPLMQDIDFSFSELRPQHSSENLLANEFSQIVLKLFEPYSIGAAG